MTPHHLHATAAAWSLQAARGRLTALARAEHRRNTDGLLAAAPIASPTYGTRHSTGDHGDPTGTTLLARPVRETTWTDLLGRLDRKVRWLAEQLHAADGIFDPLECIRDRIADLSPATARLAHRHLADEDAWVRAAIGARPDRQPLPGVACPACQHRLVHVQTAGPQDAWTVVCAAGCLCVGAGCRCGLPGAVEGVAHIWPRTAVIGAVAGAAPTHTT